MKLPERILVKIIEDCCTTHHIGKYENQFWADGAVTFIQKPEQVIEYKVSYHKTFIQSWLKENDLIFKFNQIWQIREKCLVNLSK